MANIYCENTDCIYCAQDRSCLYKFDIIIGDVYYAGCSEYSNYRESKDYQAEYWKTLRKKNQEGKYERRKARGKLVMINGRKFFTEDNPNLNEESMRVTDGELGVFAGYICRIKNNWELYIERTQEFMKDNNYTDVLELPIAVEEGQSK